MQIKRKKFFQEDLIAILDDIFSIEQNTFKLNEVIVASGSYGMATASVSIIYKDNVCRSSSHGEGPIHATYKAVQKVFQSDIFKRMTPDNFNPITLKLVEYEVSPISEGIDAQGNVNVVIIDDKNREYKGNGFSTDIIIASTKAYVNAINLYLRKNS